MRRLKKIELAKIAADREIEMARIDSMERQAEKDREAKLAHENLKKVQIKQKAYYDRRARSRKFDVGDKVLLLLPTDNNKLLLLWNGTCEVVEVVNRMNYKIDVNSVVSTCHANMLKQYVERRNELSHCLLSAEAFESVDDDDNEEFPLDDCTFPTVKKPESYRDANIADTLTSGQRKEVETLMKQYPDVLSGLPGRSDRIQHDIKLLTSELIQTKGYSFPYKMRSVMETEIQDMLYSGVIEPSISHIRHP